MRTSIPGAIAVLIALLATGCATGGGAEEPDDDGQDDSSNGGGGSGGASAGGGDGGVPGCAAPCDSVDTPACKKGACDAVTGECVLVDEADGAACDDGAFCTDGDVCSAGACVPGQPRFCGETDGCSANVCDEAQDRCVIADAADGTACDSSEACTIGGACKAGACVGTPKDCFFFPVPNECWVASCNPATDACEAASVGSGGCDDGDPCSTSDTCSAGACVAGPAVDCSGVADECNAGACDPSDGSCKPIPDPPGASCAAVSDECNAGACDAAGVCVPVPLPGASCAATDACNVGTCDAAGACLAVPANEGAPCVDASACTTGDACSAGVCVGSAPGVTVWLTETFASNAAGWVLGPQWQIGGATASSGAALGNEDPADDHTQSADAGVAGMVLGGHVTTEIHPAFYLESPPVDTSSAGTVMLQYWRWLNSQSSPNMKCTVDVYDGFGWVNVWKSPVAQGTFDAAWTQHTHDVSAHKNPAMRVRFGLEVGGFSVQPTSGWNVDDVVIASAACP